MLCELESLALHRMAKLEHAVARFTGGARFGHDQDECPSQAITESCDQSRAAVWIGIVEAVELEPFTLPGERVDQESRPQGRTADADLHDLVEEQSGAWPVVALMNFPGEVRDGRYVVMDLPGLGSCSEPGRAKPEMPDLASFVWIRGAALFERFHLGKGQGHGTCERVERLTRKAHVREVEAKAAALIAKAQRLKVCVGSHLSSFRVQFSRRGTVF